MFEYVKRVTVNMNTWGVTVNPWGRQFTPGGNSLHLGVTVYTWG